MKKTLIMICAVCATPGFAHPKLLALIASTVFLVGFRKRARA